MVTGAADAELPEGTFAALIQTPGTYGDLHDLTPIAERVHASAGGADRGHRSAGLRVAAVAR